MPSIEVTRSPIRRIRDNPFLLNDPLRNGMLGRNRCSTSYSMSAISSLIGSNSIRPRPVSICAERDMSPCDASKLSSDLEYGPGIVQRLREKFSRMAHHTMASLTNNVQSNGSIPRRFASVDDILLPETPPNYSNISTTKHELPSLDVTKPTTESLNSSSSTGYSSEESAGLEGKNEELDNRPKKATSRTSLVQSLSSSCPKDEKDSLEAEIIPRAPIRSLREKFERSTKVEPKSVRTITSDDMESIESHDEFTCSIKCSSTGSASLIEKARDDLSFVSSKDRDNLSLALDMVNRKGEVRVGQPGNTPTTHLPPKLAAIKDATAMLEVHRLLNKFSAKRSAEQAEADAPSIKPTSQDKPPLPRPTQLTCSAPTSAPATPPRPSGISTFQTSNTTPNALNSGFSPQSCTTSPANSTASNTSQNCTPRKSLSAKYLETKQKMNTPEPVRFVDACPVPKPLSQRMIMKTGLFDDESTQMEDTASVSSTDSLDIAEEFADPNFQPGAQNSMFTSDNGPVRHSLLSLVLEEDLHDLMEAMAEELHFSFEDYESNMPSTSGIIRTQSKRRSNNTQPKALPGGRICFTQDPPKVFSYLDENSALELGEWHAGHPISYDEYQRIVQAAQEQQAEQAVQLSKWRNMMQMKFMDQEEALDSAVEQMARSSLNAPSPSSSGSRTPTPDEISRFPNYSTDASPRPNTVVRQECGTSAI